MSHSPIKFQPYTRQTIDQAPHWARLAPALREAVQVVSHVLPFRTNAYVMEHLIDWDRVPDDPIFRLTFPHRDMLAADDYAQLRALVERGDAAALAAGVHALRLRMNPHPAGQLTHNVPRAGGAPVPGLQHKYRETVLFFPAAGQTCHAYCTFCFRWPQFAGMEGDYKFSARATDELVAYLRAHRDVTDVLITGGDPLVMNSRALGQILDALLAPDLDHIQNIRLGTKSVAYWPQRFVTDRDADDLLRLFERVVATGRNLAVMGHYSHAAELRPAIARQAVRRIVGTGATLRMQGPLIRHINEDPASWAELWTTGVRLGAIPYYMFVERDTGPRDYFALPLARAHAIFRAAYARVGGLARTVRGPSMSAFPGKVMIDGVVTINGEKLFALQFLQARNPDWVRQPFYARFDPAATWLDQLEPAFGRPRFFFQDEDEPARVIPIQQLRA